MAFAIVHGGVHVSRDFIRAPMKKEKAKDERVVGFKMRETYHKAAVKAAKADRRGVQVWIENAIIETAERQQDARKAKK